MLCVVCVALMVLAVRFMNVWQTRQDAAALETGEVREVAVRQVIDGDTLLLQIDGEKLRLTGIDAPESTHWDQSKNTVYGAQASDHLKELVRAGSSVWVYLPDGVSDPGRQAGEDAYANADDPEEDAAADTGGTSDPDGTSDPGITSDPDAASDPGITSDPDATSDPGITSDPGATSGSGGASDSDGVPRDRDNYDRLLRLVWTKRPDISAGLTEEVLRESLNGRMLLDGYAVTYIMDEEPWGDAFYRFQKEAMDSKAGLWADPGWIAHAAVNELIQ